jgi:hypothetical protein
MLLSPLHLRGNRRIHLNIINNPLSMERSRRERGRGRLTRRKQQSQAIIRDPISQYSINLSPDVPKGADEIVHYPIYQTHIGPRYSLSTLTIGNTYVCFLFDHYSIVLQYHLFRRRAFNFSLPNFVPEPFLKIIILI